MKKQRKWIVSLTIFVIMALALVACGGGTTESAETPAEESAETAEEAAPVGCL
jgi:ABC-type glycerol-3-phosphate transport system substrate-binding protein